MFSQNEIIIMIGVVGTLLICIIILTILDIKEYLKNKKGILNENLEFGPEYVEDNKNVEPVQLIEVPDLEEKNVLASTVSKEVKNNDEVLLEEMDDEKFEINDDNTYIQEVEEDIKEAIPIKEETINSLEEKKEKKKIELFEELDEMEENLPNKKDDITNFEMEQERTAIISLDELLKKSNEIYNDNEIVQYDDGDEPISIDEVISRFRQESEIVKEEIKETPMVMKSIEEEKVEPYSRKESIPFISSVYGIEKSNNALEFENTANYEKLDREKYNDFVAKLREMNEKE